jgi:phospholipid transport system transporter-binding protein
MTTITQNGNCWDLQGNILIDSANMLLEKSKAFTLTNGTLVDFSQVGEVDTSAVSLMLEWRRRAIAENKQLSFVNFPAGLTSLAVLYGVTDLIS